jgi:hypothetical protein
VCYIQAFRYSTCTKRFDAPFPIRGQEYTDINYVVQTLSLFPPSIFKVNGQVDVVLASPRYSGSAWKGGVFIGIKMKTHITEHSFIQAQAECLILSVNSAMPVIQVWYALVSS